MPKIPIILLSAGASTRMGSPKALLKWNKKTLIESRIETFSHVNQPFLVVLGDNADKILPLIENKEYDVVINRRWEEGMGSTIAFGLNELLKKYSTLDGVLITTIDQPLVDSSHIKKLLETFENDKKQIIVSESRDGWVGIPVLFDSHYFDMLCSLRGDTGAKTLVKKHAKNVIKIYAGENLVDMDTPDTYEKLYKLSTNSYH